MAAADINRTTYGAQGAFARIGSFLVNFGGMIAAWNDARVTRNALSTLSDRDLDDIGLSRCDIEAVAHSRARI